MTLLGVQVGECCWCSTNSGLSHVSSCELWNLQKLSGAVCEWCECRADSTVGKCRTTIAVNAEPREAFICLVKVLGEVLDAQSLMLCTVQLVKRTDHLCYSVTKVQHNMAISSQVTSKARELLQQ